MADADRHDHKNRTLAAIDALFVGGKAIGVGLDALGDEQHLVETDRYLLEIAPVKADPRPQTVIAGAQL